MDHAGNDGFKKRERGGGGGGGAHIVDECDYDMWCAYQRSAILQEH